MKPPYASRCKNLTGIYGPILTPGSDGWFQTMSASKVAAVLGLSPFTSRFTLWHQMNGTAAKTETTDVMRRGHYLEPAIREWLKDQLRWKVIRTGTWTHPEIPWATATPDGLVLGAPEGARLVEIKSASNGDEWGKAYSDEIPAGYRAQIMWQLMVTGATYCHVAVLLPFLEMREYLVGFDQAEADYILAGVVGFMESLKAGIAPPLDGADSTYQTVRELHPEIDGTDVEVDPITAIMFLNDKRGLTEAVATEQESRSKMLDAMGNAKRAVCNGVVVATRTAKNGGTPYLSYPRSLPTLADLKEIA